MYNNDEINRMEAINFLMELRYDDDMIKENKRRIKRNEIIDWIIRRINEDIPKPKRKTEDPDCPNGVCPIR